MKMQNLEEFKQYAHAVVDWIADYYQNIESYPVKSKVKPGDIFRSLPPTAPEQGESMDKILADFNSIIIPGITHWQSPGFHAYFPSNVSYPSVLAEMLTAALGAQCMKWDTSPAAAELEEKVICWMKTIIKLPQSWDGAIQDSASSSTLNAILSAREKHSNFNINKMGFNSEQKFRIYCSTEAHSSIEKAVKIAGIGSENLIKVPTDDVYRMNTKELENLIVHDINCGYRPLCVVAAIGTTGSTAIDEINKIVLITEKYDMWLHVDAAFAGTALLLPEYQWMAEEIHRADSFVFNPHKWMFTNFDCSLYFVKEKQYLIRTFEILPEYLKTTNDKVVNNYCDWGVPLGRRFRALKLWFVLRSFGLDKLRQMLRFHIQLANEMLVKMNASNNFRILAPVHFNLICFQYIKNTSYTDEQHNEFNSQLLQAINNDGRLYLSHTKLSGRFALRIVLGSTFLTQAHVEKAFDVINEIANTII